MHGMTWMRRSVPLYYTEAIPIWSPTMLCKCGECEISSLLRHWRCPKRTKPTRIQELCYDETRNMCLLFDVINGIGFWTERLEASAES